MNRREAGGAASLSTAGQARHKGRALAREAGAPATRLDQQPNRLTLDLGGRGESMIGWLALSLSAFRSGWLVLCACTTIRLFLQLAVHRGRRPIGISGLARHLLVGTTLVAGVVLAGMAAGGFALWVASPQAYLGIEAGAFGRCAAVSVSALVLEWWISSKLPHEHRWPWTVMAIATCLVAAGALEWLHGRTLILGGAIAGLFIGVWLVVRFAVLRRRGSAKVVTIVTLALALLAGTGVVALRMSGLELGIELGLAVYVAAVSVTATLAELDALPSRPDWVPDTSAARPMMVLGAASLGALAGVSLAGRSSLLLASPVALVLTGVFVMRIRADRARNATGGEPPCWAVRWFSATVHLRGEAEPVRFTGPLEKVVREIFHTISGIPVEQDLLQQVAELYCHHPQVLIIDRNRGGTLWIQLTPHPAPARGRAHETVVVAQWCGHSGQPRPLVAASRSISEWSIAEFLRDLPENAPRSAAELAGRLWAELARHQHLAVKLVLPKIGARPVADRALLVAVLPHRPSGSARVPPRRYRNG